MKFISLILLFVILYSCNPQTSNEKQLQTRIDSLESQIADTYKPGFGEFMSSIQSHHAKLWFAGENQNWKLCDFEIHEIMESFEDIQKYQKERPETQLVTMIFPAIDSVNDAIEMQNPQKFKSSYILLTNTCNSCHQTAQFEFNVVKIPEEQNFSNQDFSIQKN